VGAGDWPTEPELHAFRRDHLAAYKTPVTWIFVDAFLPIASGKVRKNVLHRATHPGRCDLLDTGSDSRTRSGPAAPRLGACRDHVSPPRAERRIRVHQLGPAGPGLMLATAPVDLDRSARPRPEHDHGSTSRMSMVVTWLMKSPLGAVAQPGARGDLVRVPTAAPPSFCCRTSSTNVGKKCHGLIVEVSS